MKFTKIALAITCSALLFCGCAKDSDVVMKINNTEITRAQFYGDLNKIQDIQFKNAPKEMKKNMGYAKLVLKTRYINDLITRTLLEEDFSKWKIEATEDEIKAKKEELIKKVGSEEELNKKLQESGISSERFEKDLASEVKAEKLIKQVTSTIKVSDSEIAKFYNDNKAQFTVPERAEVAHILFDTNPDNIKRALIEKDKDANISSKDIDLKVKDEITRKEALAKDVATKAAKNPKQFAQLAKQYSEDPATKDKGGDLGFIFKEQVEKEFGDVAFVQKVGTVSPLVKTRYGLHIIYVKDRSAGGVQKLDRVKNDLRVYLLEQKKVEAFQKYLQGLKNGIKIEYFEDSLKPENLEQQLKNAIPKELLQGAPEQKEGFVDKIKKFKEEKMKKSE